MALSLPSFTSITSAIVLLAVCPLLALCAASPPVLANAKSNNNTPLIDGSGLGGEDNLPQQAPFLAPVVPVFGARDATLGAHQDGESRSVSSGLERRINQTPRLDEDRRPFHAASDSRPFHAASDSRPFHAASDSRPFHAASDSRPFHAASDSRPFHAASDSRPFQAASERDRGFRVQVVDGFGPDSERSSSPLIDDDAAAIQRSNDGRNATGRTEARNSSAAAESGDAKVGSVIRGIMENFADDFESPPDAQLAEDVFNREPYYYDVYYDTVDNDHLDIEPESTFTGGDNGLPREEDDSFPAVTAGAEPADPFVESADLGTGEEDLANVQEALDLRLLGADLQAELGFVLQQLTNGSQRNRRHQAPVRLYDPRQSQGINVGLQVGACPPPVHSLPPGLCGAPPCTSHMMCYPQKMCCFNGCTYTCTEPVRPPPIIDWLEDTGSRQPLLDPLNPALPLRFESSPLSYGTGGGETIRLPGGCTLTAGKYEELKEFMTAESIQDCLCSGGEVVCLVKSAPGE